jgi:hypothetical protein
VGRVQIKESSTITTEGRKDNGWNEKDSNGTEAAEDGQHERGEEAHAAEEGEVLNKRGRTASNLLSEGGGMPDSRVQPYCNKGEHCADHERNTDGIETNTKDVSTMKGIWKAIAGIMGIGTLIMGFAATVLTDTLKDIRTGVDLIQKSMYSSGVDVGKLQVELENLKTKINTIENRMDRK